MAQVLDRTTQTVLLKVSVSEYDTIKNSGILDTDTLDNYEFIFDEPVLASELLKTL